MRLYNTQSAAVEDFIPRDEGRVGIYVCGPTVYDVPHFGHARAVLVPDVLRRYLEWCGYAVLFVRNVTDVDDKIIARALQEGRPPAAVTEEYTRVYDQQMARLGVAPPDIAPRATGHILEMIELIERLVAVGAAYESGGDVFFAVRSFDRYGVLSHRNVDELRAGARVAPDERKHDPVDFALWKAAKPGEPSWPSPWGRGRPGWHIECSAMSAKYLGAGFDIHAGGLDLIFPHHENELAQSEAAGDVPFARYWMHNGMVTIDSEKMSKSLGNYVTLAQALDTYDPNVVRFFLLSAQYRSPVDFSAERLVEAGAAFSRWQAFLRAARPDRPGIGDGRGETPRTPPDAAEPYRARFMQALSDDLSTPQAHAVLFDLVAEGNRHLEAGRSAEAAQLGAGLLELGGVLGYSFAPEAAELSLVGPLIELALRLRGEARARRDFAGADQIRTWLGELGVVVEDSSDGSRWHLAGAGAGPA